MQGVGRIYFHYSDARLLAGRFVKYIKLQHRYLQ